MKISGNRKNYPAIDIAKFVCALVILLYHYFSEHGPIPSLLEDALSLYAVAVALFMTLSGFLLFDKLKRIPEQAAQWQVVKGQIKRIMTIYLLWSIPYLIFSIYTWDWANVSFSFVAWKIQVWVFNSTFYTIWFMPALAIGTLFAWFLYSRLRWRNVCLVAGVFYILGALQMTYSFVGEEIPGFTAFTAFSAMWLQGARGGIFFGMPLIIVGAAASRITWRNPFVLAGSSVILLGCLVAEALILRKFVGGCGLDLAMLMPILCLSATMFLTSMSWNANYKWMRSMSVLIFMTQRVFLTVIPELLPGVNNLFGNVYMGMIIAGGCVIGFSVLIISLSRNFHCLKYLY